MAELSYRERMQREKTKRLFMKCIKKALSAPEMLTVSEWAEKYRILGNTSATPGPWHNERTPYLSEIMDCFNDPYIQHITFVKPTQVGGTEALINIIGWIAAQSPASSMIVYPTDELAKNVSNDRLKPAFEISPALKKLFRETKSNELNIKLKNMLLYLRSGGSAGKLASNPIKYLLFDEIDKMPGASKKEANPYNLALQRTGTYKYSKKIYACSTPTIKENYIWRLHTAAEEQREYFVPCPHCGEYITLEWEYVKFPKYYDEINKTGEMPVEERAAAAYYVCRKCGGIISDKDKRSMLIKGKWRTVKKTHSGKVRSVSFHLNALYANFITWEDAALEYLKSRDDPEEHQNFINSWLAQPWEDASTKTSADMVMERQSSEAAGIVPDWALLLTAGVDVQETHVYFDIVAWGGDRTSQSIFHGKALSLNDLTAYIYSVYSKENGEKLEVRYALIDSGDQTDMVYEYCLHNSDKAIACKGIARADGYYKISKINKIGSAWDGQILVLVDGGKYKDFIASRLRRPNGKGSCMVHSGCDEEYAKQLTNEHKVAEGSGYRRKLVWRPKYSHADNHYLDCRVYASCAADLCGVQMLTENMQENKKRPAVQYDSGEYGEDWI